MSWRKFLIIPQLIYYGVRAPKQQHRAWDGFWSRIRKTGLGGEVLWDSGSPEELAAVLARLKAHMDLSLPIVDFGCGNGRFAREFASQFARVVGADVSEHAIQRANVESKHLGPIDFRVLDVAEPGAGAKLCGELGEANVYMRGVMHVLDRKQRAIAEQNLAAIVGKRGTVYVSETNIEGDPLEHLEIQGATASSMPEPLRRCIEAGIRPPSHFGDREVRESFPPERWQVLESGKIEMVTLGLHPGLATETLPSFYAVLRRK